MSVVNINALPAANGQVTSFYGASFWFTQGGPVCSQIQQGSGSAWVVWKLSATDIPAGEAINVITLDGGNKFTSPGGTRQATLYYRLSHSFDYGPSASGTALQTLIGNGATNSSQLSIVPPAGYTSTDLLNGTFFLGFAINTTNVEIGQGEFCLGALSWGVYSGLDQPNPPVSSGSARITNPAGNISPGVLPGGQFASLTWTHLTPRPRNSITYSFQVPSSSGLTFVNGGLYYIASIPGGAVGNPSNPYTPTTGLINVPANCPPGTYTFRGQEFSAGMSPTETIVLTATLVVRSIPGNEGAMYCEA